MLKTRDLKVRPREWTGRIRSESFDESKGTFDVVVTTGEAILRNDYMLWDGPYYEELGLKEGEVRLARLNSGRLNLLDNHGYANGADWGPSKYQTGNVVGVALANRARVEKIAGADALLSTFQVSRRDELAGLRTDLKDGVVAQCSPGYRVYLYEMTIAPLDGTPPTFRAVDWEPTEVSLTAVPAEEGAHVRTSAQSENPCRVIDRRPDTQQRTMKRKVKNAAGVEVEVEVPETEGDGTRTAVETPPAPVAAPAAPSDAERAAASAQGATSERARAEEIRTLTRTAKLPAEFGDNLVKTGTPIEKARAAIVEEWAKQGAPATPATPSDTTRAEVREVGNELDAMQVALIHRGAPHLVPVDKLTPQARSFVQFSLLDLARHLLEKRGERTRGMDRSKIVERSLMAASEFPELLANTASKSLRDQYEIMPNTWQAWCRRGTLPDFKIMSRVGLSGAPTLEEVPETGAIKRGALSEMAEKYRLKTYGKIVPISRQAIINDDLSGFTRIPAAFAVSASTLIEDLVYSILTTNAAMADTVALFHATHKNLSSGAGSALALAGLGAARTLLRNQTGQDGKYLNLNAAYIIVPAALETTAEQLTLPFGAVVATNINPWAGRLKHITQPRLDVASAIIWFAVIDPAFGDTIEVGFLEGQSGPRIESRTGFDVEGLEIKCALDVGAKAIDWRGMVKSAGA